LQVDLKKAFKSIARPAILKDLEHQCPSMMPWVQQAFQPAPLLIGRELNFCFLFSAGIHAALGALPPGGTMHSWYLDDGVFMGSLVEVEGVLAALQQALPPPWAWNSTCGRPQYGPGACNRDVPPRICHAPAPGGGDGGTPTSDATWVQTTLPMSEGGCVVASAADVAPVARLAGIMQFLARAEPMLGCDRQLVVPLATEAGLLDALNARLPPALEPLASWTRTGKV